MSWGDHFKVSVITRPEVRFVRFEERLEDIIAFKSYFWAFDGMIIMVSDYVMQSHLKPNQKVYLLKGDIAQ